MGHLLHSLFRVGQLIRRERLEDNTGEVTYGQCEQYLQVLSLITLRYDLRGVKHCLL